MPLLMEFGKGFILSRCYKHSTPARAVTAVVECELLGFSDDCWRRVFGSLAVIFSLLLFLPERAVGQPSREVAFKAVSLFHLAQFTEWPASAFESPEAPIVIGILGKDPFGSALESIRKRRVGNRSLEVKRFQAVDQIKVCHVLYISPSEEGQLEKILASLKNRSILIVGDAERFAKRGGMIEFMTQQSRIRFRVNLGAVRSAGLQISSKLLRWSEVINS